VNSIVEVAIEKKKAGAGWLGTFLMGRIGDWRKGLNIFGGKPKIGQGGKKKSNSQKTKNRKAETFISTEGLGRRVKSVKEFLETSNWSDHILISRTLTSQDGGGSEWTR